MNNSGVLRRRLSKVDDADLVCELTNDAGRRVRKFRLSAYLRAVTEDDEAFRRHTRIEEKPSKNIGCRLING